MFLFNSFVFRCNSSRVNLNYNKYFNNLQYLIKKTKIFDGSKTKRIFLVNKLSHNIIINEH